MHLEEHKQKIINIIDNNHTYTEKLQAICDFLKTNINEGLL